MTPETASRKVAYSRVSADAEEWWSPNDAVLQAMAAGQVQAAESGLGPNEPIDWAVVFMAEGHHRNVNDDPD